MHVMVVSPKPRSKKFSPFILLATRQAKYFGLFEKVTRLVAHSKLKILSTSSRVEWESSIQYLIDQLTAKGFLFRHKINRDGSG